MTWRTNIEWKYIKLAYKYIKKGKSSKKKKGKKVKTGKKNVILVNVILEKGLTI